MSTERDARLDDLIEANKEAERYAGKMERALERIATVCRLVRSAPVPIKESEVQAAILAMDALAALDVIEGLAVVRDDRRRIAPLDTYAPKQG